jgi:hypothetical protein
MRGLVDIFVHDYGEAVLGPICKAYMEEMDNRMLAASKRSNAYREARRLKADAEYAICVLARMYFTANEVLKKTP